MTTVPTLRLTQLDRKAADPDAAADELLRQYRRRAAVVCGAAGAVPAAGAWLELLTLAELNHRQISDIAAAYGFSVEPVWGERAPAFLRHPAALFSLMFASLEVEAFRREGGHGANVGEIVRFGSKRWQWRGLALEVASKLSRRLMVRALKRYGTRLVPLLGAALSATASYKFTQATGEQARDYFKELAAKTERASKPLA